MSLPTAADPVGRNLMSKDPQRRIQKRLNISSRWTWYVTIMSICLPSPVLRKLNAFSSLNPFTVTSGWTSTVVVEDNSMVFTSRSVPFPATRDLQSLVAGHGTSWETKTVSFSSHQWRKNILITSHSVSFQATHDLRSLVAGNGTSWETKTNSFSSHQWR